MTAAFGCVPCGLLEEAGGQDATGGPTMEGRTGGVANEAARRAPLGPVGKRDGSVNGVSKTGRSAVGFSRTRPSMGKASGRARGGLLRRIQAVPQSQAGQGRWCWRRMEGLLEGECPCWCRVPESPLAVAFLLLVELLGDEEGTDSGPGSALPRRLLGTSSSRRSAAWRAWSGMAGRLVGWSEHVCDG